MGDFSPKSSMEIKPLIESYLQKLIKLNDEGVAKILKIWRNIYGCNDANLINRLTNLENHLKEFWEGEVENEEERQKTHYDILEQMGKEAFDLEKALGVDFGVCSIHANIPLMQMEEQLRKILDSCREMRDKRVTEYSLLQLKEEGLCTILGVKPKFHDYSKTSLNLASNKNKSSVVVPTLDDIKKCEKRIEDLEKMRDQLEYDFINYKYELISLINDCEIIPATKIERFACSNEETDRDFPITKDNLKVLESAVIEYRKKKYDMVTEGDHLREEITKLYRQMLKSQEELNHFLSENYGFTKTTILKLKSKLSELKEERKINLENLILSQRKLLEDLWDKCCYSEEQRAKFQAFQATHYSEEVLSFHEIEVEQLEDYYTKHTRIFQLLEKHEELWERLLDLEELASDANRLFDNRGGQLLQEEKERKMIQKKVPAVQAELNALLLDYKVKNGIDFLYFGVPFQDFLEQKEQDYESCKENRKQERKATNKVMFESRPGTLKNSTNRLKRKLAPQDTPSATITKKRALQGTPSTSTIKKWALQGTPSTSTIKKRTLQGTYSASTTKKQAPSRYKVVSATPVTKCSTPHVEFTATSRLDMHSCQRRNVRSPVYTRARRDEMSRTSVRPQSVSTSEKSTLSYESFREQIERSSHKKVYGNTVHQIDGRTLRPRNLNQTQEIASSRMTPYKTPGKTPSGIPFRCAMGSKIPTIVTPLQKPRKIPRSSKLPLMF